MKNPLSGLFGRGKPATGSAGTVLRGAGAAAPAGVPAMPAPTRQQAVAWTPGNIVLEDYQVLGQLGKGSFGHVYLLVLSQSTRQRFAVKRAFIASEQERRLFLDELKNWIDLPEHPHLVSCRFFRTAGSEIVIFADYVAGGDLSKWIAAGKLKSLESILDVAIQFAWGLHAAHELEVIHQDVKPGNALMTPEGVVRVADFGLARARSRVSGQAEHSGGYTEAYCSPEQLRGEVSRRSDLWSWGVSVLEMLAGGVSWKLGFEAAMVLEKLIRAQPQLANGQPAFPAPIAEVLRRCFHDAPEDRWPTLLAAAQALEGSHQSLIGRPYLRCAPQFPRRDAQRADLDRRAGNSPWDDPREWLKEALQAVGRDPAEVERIAHSGRDVQSLKAQAIADLGNYQQAQLLFEQAIAGGRSDLRSLLALLCMHRAFVHRFVEDLPGAVQCYDTGIAIYESLVNREGQRELSSYLVTAYLNKAIVVGAQQDLHAAVALYDQCIATCERLVNREGQREVAVDLALAYMNKGSIVRDLGSHMAGLELYDQGIALYERLVNQQGRRELTLHLAAAYLNKANAVAAMANLPGSLALYDQGIALYERLVNGEGRRELSSYLATAYLNKAAGLSALRGDLQVAVALQDQGIAVYERLVNAEGRRELTSRLADAYKNKANTVRALGNPQAAVALYEQCISIYERLVKREGRRELAGDLAWAEVLLAIALKQLGDRVRAASLARAAVATLATEVQRTGQSHLKGALQGAHENLGDLLD